MKAGIGGLKWMDSFLHEGRDRRSEMGGFIPA